MAGYLFVLTNLPLTFSAESVLQLYRFRWQIEIKFKTLKSVLHLDNVPARTDDLTGLALERPIDVKFPPDASALYILDFGQVEYKADGRQKISSGTGRIFRLVPSVQPSFVTVAYPPATAPTPCRFFSSRQSFSSSTDCKVSRPGPCAGWATHEPRCYGTSRDTGSSACRSDICCVFAGTVVSLACGGACPRAS